MFSSAMRPATIPFGQKFQDYSGLGEPSNANSLQPARSKTSSPAVERLIIVECLPPVHRAPEKQAAARRAAQPDGDASRHWEPSVKRLRQTLSQNSNAGLGGCPKPAAQVGIKQETATPDLSRFALNGKCFSEAGLHRRPELRSNIELYDFQTDLIRTVQARIKAGIRRLITQLPTGAGKTIIASELIRQATDRGERALFLIRSPRVDEAIFEQAVQSRGRFRDNPSWISCATQRASTSRLGRNSICAGN